MRYALRGMRYDHAPNWHSTLLASANEDFYGSNGESCSIVNCQFSILCSSVLKK